MEFQIAGEHKQIRLGLVNMQISSVSIKYLVLLLLCTQLFMAIFINIFYMGIEYLQLAGPDKLVSKFSLSYSRAVYKFFFKSIILR